MTGPTARYVSRYPAGDPEIALVDRASPPTGSVSSPGKVRPLRGQQPPRCGRGMVYLTGGIGVDLPDVGHRRPHLRGTNLTGVLAYPVRPLRAAGR